MIDRVSAPIALGAAFTFGKANAGVSVSFATSGVRRSDAAWC